MAWRARFCTGTSWTWSGWRCTSPSTFSEFQTDPLLLVPLAGAGLGFVVGYRRLARRGHARGALRRRAWLFAAGYLTLLVALLSPLHAAGETWFSLHMVQHLLLSLVAPPLLLLSNSMPVLLWALPRDERAGLGRLVGQPGPLRRLLRAATHPVLAWWLFVGAQWLWHQPAAYDLALDNRWAHYAEHLTFFGTGVLFWWPVVGAAPLRSPLGYPGRMLYTFLAWMPNSFLGAGLTLSPGLLYPHYAATGATAAEAHGDQVLAGLLMWVPGDVTFAAIMLLLLVAYLRQEERDAVRIDRELDLLEQQGLLGLPAGASRPR